MLKTTGFIGLAALLLLLPAGVMAQQSVRWEASLEDAQRVAGQSNRLVLIYFWAPWCGVCKNMEAEILTQPSVVAEVTARYVPVRINADHFPATARQYGVTALPTTAIVNARGELVDSMRGRMEADEYIARLDRVATDLAQRGGAVYAQVPSGKAPSAPAAATPTQSSPSNTGQSPVALAQSPRAGGPASGANPQPSTQPAGNNSGLTDNRYADFFQRGNQATPGAAVPIAQPPSGQPIVTNVQPPPMYTPPSASATPPTMAVAQANPPVQPPLTGQPAAAPNRVAPAVAAPAYGSQSPPLSPQQLVSQPAGKPSPAGPTTPQPSAGNPPLCLDGFCPVTLTEKQQWTPGDRRWGAIHRGRTYLFTGPEEQRRFFADPDRYAPVISGNDIVLATEQGQAAPGMREHGVFFGNRVYLFSSEATLAKFAANPSPYVTQALGALRPGAYAGQPQQ
jgi:YHS domain-containing protein/thiol-disulfide isomerase/thioredoxin